MKNYSHVNYGRRQGERAYIVHWSNGGKKMKTRLLMVGGRLTHNRGPFLPQKIFHYAQKDIAQEKFGKNTGIKTVPWWHQNFPDAVAHQRVCETVGACEKWR